MRIRLYLVLILVFASGGFQVSAQSKPGGGTVQSQTSATQQNELEVLSEVIKQNLILLKDDFSNLPDYLSNYEMIFLGERHGIAAYFEAENKFAMQMSKARPIVLALESYKRYMMIMVQ